MSRADVMAINAAATLATWGETILMDGQPLDAIVDRNATDIDPHGRVSAPYFQLMVLESVADTWGDAPTFVVDGKNYRLGPQIDRNGLARFPLVKSL